MKEIGAFERSASAVWERPQQAVLAFRAVVAALIFGIAETLMRASILLDRPGETVASIGPALLIRVAIYVAVFAVAARMLTGSRWARWVLVIGLGTVGLASLVIEPLRAVLDAEHPGDLFAGWTWQSAALGVFRAGHVIAVLVAVPAAMMAGRVCGEPSGHAHSGGTSPVRTSSGVVTGRSQTEPRQM